MKIFIELNHGDIVEVVEEVYRSCNVKNKSRELTKSATGLTNCLESLRLGKITSEKLMEYWKISIWYHEILTVNGIYIPYENIKNIWVE